MDLRWKDRQFVWHPYSDIDRLQREDFPLIERAEGCYIYDKEGRRYLDGIASWWCVNFGHSHPELIRAIRAQSEKLQNVILAGMSHESAILLAEELVKIAPKHDSKELKETENLKNKALQHCYFASDGASAVEAALRMALHYWENLGVQQRKKFICLQDAYHGDTLGTIGVGYVEHFHHQLKTVVPDNYRAVSPHCATCPFGLEPSSCDTECFASMQGLIEGYGHDCAAVIVEPLCQGAGGIRLYPEAYLQKLRQFCNEYGILLICDEIAVGFGRMGSMFASQRAGIVPDLMTIGKGLTGGYLPMSAVLANDEIYQSFRPACGGTTFFHGHTYCGNPIVSALALRAVSLYKELDVLAHVQTLIPLLEQGIRDLQERFLPLSYSSAKGMIGAIEISNTEGGAERAASTARRAWERGLFVRPLGSVLYLWPPLVISREELEFCFGVLFEVLAES